MSNANFFWTTAAGRGLLALGAVVLIVGPALFSIPQLQLLTQFLSLLVIAIMWNLLAGYADIVSIGQHALSASAPMRSMASPSSPGWTRSWRC